MNLTNLICERLHQTHRGKGLVKDEATPQLYLRVSKTGIAAWVRIDQAGGKRSEVVIGHFPQVSLGEARARIGSRSGATAGRGNVTVGAAISRYLKERESQLAPKTMHALRVYLEQDLAPLSRLALSALTRDAVKAIIAGRTARTPGAAKRLFAACKHFSWWCADSNLLPVDPLAAMRRKGLLAKDEPTGRALTKDEVMALMKAEGQIARILQFALLTGQRIGEVLQITDDQIDGDHWWTIPAGIRKVRREHHVYLSAQARKVYGKEGLYQYSYSATNFWKRREGATWLIHDLRRTAATLMQEQGIASDVVGRCLGHQIGGRLVRTYQLDEQRPAMRLGFEALGKRVAEIAGR